ncbi:MAG TPA: hypothetical protein DEQ02_10500 [Ruminococcaceae bacterium]|nr:hypothetical protein [Oscillospiraceae bacterium]
MEKNEILEQIIEYLKAENGLQNLAITGESGLLTDLGLNSYELVEMCLKVEAIFDIEADENDFRYMTVVSDVVDYVCEKRQETEL